MISVVLLAIAAIVEISYPKPLLTHLTRQDEQAAALTPLRRGLVYGSEVSTNAGESDNYASSALLGDDVEDVPALGAADGRLADPIFLGQLVHPQIAQQLVDLVP